MDARHVQTASPTPSDVQNYDRLLREAERASAHLREMEAQTLRANLLIDLVTRAIAFAFAIAALGVAAFLAVKDQPWVAAAIVIGTLCAAAAAHLSSRRD